jgi:hypothetical protein
MQSNISFLDPISPNQIVRERQAKFRKFIIDTQNMNVGAITPFAHKSLNMQDRLGQKPISAIGTGRYAYAKLDEYKMIE